MKADITRLSSLTFRITVSGSVTSDTVSDLEATVNSITEDSLPQNIQFDFEKVDYISSAGLRFLLKLRKKGIILQITQVTPEVYEIFDMTGFTDMFDVQKKFRNMDITGCDMIGCGSNGMVYRIDPETVLKLYTRTDVLPEIRAEQEHAKYALQAGIPTAISFDIVKVGEKYGSVFELIDARSVASLLEEAPDKADSFIPSYVALLKCVHSIPYKETAKVSLPDAHMKFIGYIDAIASYIPAQTVSLLQKFVSLIPRQHTVLHGDCQPGNVMVTKDELLFIDMDTLSFGNPLFDLGYLYSTLILYRQLPTVQKLFHISLDVLADFWQKMFALYYEDCSAEERERLRSMCAIISHVQVLRYLLRHPDQSTEEQIHMVSGNLQKLSDYYFSRE